MDQIKKALAESQVNQYAAIQSAPQTVYQMPPASPMPMMQYPMV
jgi:hypothetical protein